MNIPAVIFRLVELNLWKCLDVVPTNVPGDQASPPTTSVLRQAVGLGSRLQDLEVNSEMVNRISKDVCFALGIPDVPERFFSGCVYLQDMITVLESAYASRPC